MARRERQEADAARAKAVRLRRMLEKQDLAAAKARWLQTRDAAEAAWVASHEEGRRRKAREEARRARLAELAARKEIEPAVPLDEGCAAILHCQSLSSIGIPHLRRAA